MVWTVGLRARQEGGFASLQVTTRALAEDHIPAGRPAALGRAGGTCVLSTHCVSRAFLYGLLRAPRQARGVGIAHSCFIAKETGSQLGLGLAAGGLRSHTWLPPCTQGRPAAGAPIPPLLWLLHHPGSTVPPRTPRGEELGSVCAAGVSVGFPTDAVLHVCSVYVHAL